MLTSAPTITDAAPAPKLKSMHGSPLYSAIGLVTLAFASSPLAAQSDETPPPSEAQTEAGESADNAKTTPQEQVDESVILLETPLPERPEVEREKRKQAAKEAKEKAKEAAKKKDAEPLPAAERVLRQARALLEERGCAAAAPALRVAAAWGEGYEAAQQELGECLLTLSTTSEDASPLEASLMREEGVFALRRAAYAGNARAQRRLAILYATPTEPEANPHEALKWALVYEENPEASLYGFGPFPPTMVDGLKRDVGPAQTEAAEAFAAGFTETPLSQYEPPKPKKKKRRRIRTGRL